MGRKLDIIIADSSGNVTIMVITKTKRSDYKSVAQTLLSMETLGGEQVAFLHGEDKMEMCGLEFCGNASRAYALYKSRRVATPHAKRNSRDADSRGAESQTTTEPRDADSRGAESQTTTEPSDADSRGAESQTTTEPSEITVNVSGCTYPLTATVSDDGTVDMNMPIPERFEFISKEQLAADFDGTFVHIDGISHLILKDVEAKEETFNSIKKSIYAMYPDLAAMGVMFCDTASGLMTPVVYVKDVDTTYFEGSCASGTVAASYALAMSEDDGVLHYEMVQPKGLLSTKVTKENGQIKSIKLQGRVTLSDIITVEI